MRTKRHRVYWFLFFFSVAAASGDPPITPQSLTTVRTAEDRCAKLATQDSRNIRIKYSIQGDDLTETDKEAMNRVLLPAFMWTQDAIKVKSDSPDSLPQKIFVQYRCPKNWQYGSRDGSFQNEHICKEGEPEPKTCLSNDIPDKYHAKKLFFNTDAKAIIKCLVTVPLSKINTTSADLNANLKALATAADNDKCGQCEHFDYMPFKRDKNGNPNSIHTDDFVEIFCYVGVAQKHVDKGGVDADVMVFVYAEKDFTKTGQCQKDTVAFATTCAQNSCGRPTHIGMYICNQMFYDTRKNKKTSIYEAAEKYVKSKNDTGYQETFSHEYVSEISEWVHTVIHELFHGLGYNNNILHKMRDKDGKLQIPPNGANDTGVQYKCTQRGDDTKPVKAAWSDVADKTEAGAKTLYDLKGFTFDKLHDTVWDHTCKCPNQVDGVKIDAKDMQDHCITPQGVDRFASCTRKYKGKKSTQKVKEHFACDTLDYFEFENQDTSPCTVFSPHAEGRSYIGDLMPPVRYSGHRPFISTVMLAFLEDTGWWEANFDMADKLIKDYHGLYHAGCNFVEKLDFKLHSRNHVFCSEKTSAMCTSDRSSIASCGISAEIQKIEKKDVFSYATNTGVYVRGTHPTVDYVPLIVPRQECVGYCFEPSEGGADKAQAACYEVTCNVKEDPANGNKFTFEYQVLKDGDASICKSTSDLITIKSKIWKCADPEFICRYHEYSKVIGDFAKIDQSPHRWLTYALNPSKWNEQLMRTDGKGTTRQDAILSSGGFPVGVLRKDKKGKGQKQSRWHDKITATGTISARSAKINAPDVKVNSSGLFFVVVFLLGVAQVSAIALGSALAVSCREYFDKKHGVDSELVSHHGRSSVSEESWRPEGWRPHEGGRRHTAGWGDAELPRRHP